MDAIVRVILIVLMVACVTVCALKLRPRLIRELMWENGYRPLRLHLNSLGKYFVLNMLAGLARMIEGWGLPISAWDYIIFTAFTISLVGMTYRADKMFSYKPSYQPKD